MAHNLFLKEIFKWSFVVVGVLSLVYLYRDFSLSELQNIAETHRLKGAVFFGFIMFTTTVVAPISSLPLVPLIAPILGPFTTGIACYGGWSLGSLVAFLIARYLGRPFIEKYVTTTTFKRYEKLFTSNPSIGMIALIHVIVPVDILSYGFGLFTKVGVVPYTIGTSIGIAWFSFAFPYMGSWVVRGDYVLFTSISVASMIILYSGWSYLRRISRQ